MSNYRFLGKLQNKEGTVNVKLILFHFIDEQDIHFIYSPHLDVSGYGKNEEEAKKSFEICLEDLLDYMLKKKTVGKVLIKLGWKLKKGTAKKPRKISTPAMSSIVKENKYISDILDNYDIETFRQNVSIPAYA